MVLLKDLRGVGGRRYESMTDEGTHHLKTSVQKSIEQLEAERRHARQLIRGRIADAAMAERRHAETLTQIEACKRMLDQVADEHIERAEPLQRELQLIDQQQRDAILAREEEDPSLEPRRRELVLLLNDANESLEETIDRHNRESNRLNRERIGAAQKIQPSNYAPTTDDLFQTGSPHLLASYKVAEHDYQAAQRRLELLSDPILKTPESDLAAARVAVDRARATMSQKYQVVIQV